MCADIKVRARWILNQHNDRGPERLDSASSQRWLLAHGDQLDPASMLALRQHINGTAHLETAKAEVVREMRLIAKRPEYHFFLA